MTDETKTKIMSLIMDRKDFLFQFTCCFFLAGFSFGCDQLKLSIWHMWKMVERKYYEE